MAKRSLEPIPSKELTEDKTFVFPEKTSIVDTDEKKKPVKKVIKEEVEEKKDLVKKVATARVVDCNQLAFRKGPGLDHGMIRPLPVGTEVKVIDKSGEWANVELDGVKGYVMSKFIK